MASVYGSKVKEPKLTRRSELPFEKQSPYAADLAQAWASFGEAKSVLQRLEQTSGSPPVKDRTQRRPKPYHHVHFDPARATGAERTAHYSHMETYSSTLSSGDGVAKKSKGREGGGGKENNEYLVEPKPLNEVESQQSMEYEPHGAYVSKTGPLKSDSSRGTSYKPGRTLAKPHVHSQAGLAGSSSGESHPLPSSTSAAFSQRYDSTVRFSVPSTTSIVTFSSPSSCTLHPSPPSHSHTITTTSTTSAYTYPLSAATAASPSNPNSIGSPHSRLVGGSSAPPYSNSTAVFGPPVKFGDSSGRHVPVSTTRHPTMVRPAEAPKLYSHSRSHATSTSNSVHPKTSTQVAGVGAARSTVPIRTFELPTETLGTLRAKIELQKQAMRATSAKASNLLSSRNPTSSSATGFYPLPDGSTTATSSFASSSTSVGGARPCVPHPPPTARPLDTGERAAKRRKIASAPPPRTYTGFSTTTSGRAGTKSGSSSGAPTTVSWKSNLESVGAVGGAGGVALPSSLGAGAGSSGGGFRFSSQPTTSNTLEPPKQHHLHTHTMASKTVRKVHKIPATSEAAPSSSKPKSAWSASASKPPSEASGLITTSSWRAGKELREKILKGEEDKEVDRGRGRMDYRSTSGGSRKREDTSPAHYSSASESQSNLSSSQENISAVSSSIDVLIQPERRLSESPSQAKMKDEVERSHGARGALDVAEMLKDLEGSESPVPPPSPLGGGGGGRERERARLGQARSTTSASGGPTSKKPRYNYEPSYPSVRVRHYDQAEVQSYMLKKQEDRRRRELEEKQAREKMVREREEKLKQLYESQRKRVEANLRVKQKQRLAYSKALATGDIHIHLHTGSTTSSTSTLGSIADSAAPPVPTLAVHPPTPVSKSPTIGSLTLHVHADADAASGGLPKSTATTSMLSPRHQSSPLHPSPPSHSPIPPHTSPPRYSRLAGVSPLSSREASRSPSASPRTYSVPSSASTSPKAHRSPTVSSQDAQFHHSPPTGTTGHAHYGLRTEHAQYGGPGQPSSLLRDAGHTSAAITAPQSREERIRALTESALRLKERIAMESKRVEEGTFGFGPFHTIQQHSSPARPPFSNNKGYTPSVDLPGVRNVHEHALQAEKLRQEAEAATKIQAAYRGHRVRKSLRWKLPLGQTLGASLREGHTHRGDESRSTSSTDTLTPPLAKEDAKEKEISTPIISPLRGHTQKREGTQVHAHVHTQPPTFEANGPQIASSATAVPRLSPWQQTGGDEHSIINVFTRQHERLRQTLDQLSDQKRAEIRRFGEEGRRAQSETPKHGGSSLPASSQQPGATSITHSHSYTYTFEQASPSRSGSERSPHSSIFSEDSLHASPPPKHKPSSNKTSPSPTSSPCSHLSSPRSALSPPSRTNSASTLTGGSSPSSKSEPKSKQEERVVHAITPPGSPSFVESFASLSPRSVSSQTSEPKSFPKSSSPPKPQLSATVKPPAGSIPPPGVQVSSAAAAVPSVTLTESGGGRLSPRSLELKLHSELNLLETVEDSMRQLSQVESARAVSLAQQETVALAQLLKSRQQGHEQELQAVASKSEKEMEETRGKLDREAALMAEQRQRIEREHAEEMQRIREEASRVSHEATLRLNEARTAASDAVIQAAKEHLEAAHKIAESAASAAAREAMKATLVASGTQQQGPPPHHHHKETSTTSGSVTPNYESDFEADSLAGSETGKISETQSKLKSPATTSTRSQASGSSSTTIEEDIEQEGSDMEEEGEGGESATPVLGSRKPDEEAMEVRAGDETLVGGGGSSELEESYQSQSPIEEMEEDISEASFQLLPSESHWRQHQRQQQAKLSLGLGQQHRGRGRRDRSKESEGSSYSRGSSPSQGEGSRVPSPIPSELSPSPGAGEDSFFQFMSRMVRAYMHEEELRARHQATLLRLREDALQEKTKAHLEWLKIKKKALQRKGDDDKMPPLARMERGLLKKYKQEQAEIHRLKEAQRAARRERRVMLQQQKEISQMRRSAQYYRNKIHQHSRRVSHSPSPSPSLLLDEIKTTSSRLLDESELSMGDVSVAEELSESESQRNRKSLTEPLEEDLDQSLPREYTEDFASCTTSPEPVLTATIRTETGSGELEEAGEEGDRTLTAEDVQSQHQQTPVRSSKPKIKVSPPDDKKPSLGGERKVTRTPKSPSSESHTVKELERLAAIDPHEYLSQREQRLLKRRRAAEEVLKQQQELLKKEQILDKEEEKVNKLVTEALTCYQQRTKIKKGRNKDKERSRHSSDEEIATSAKPRSPKELSTSPRLTKSPLEGERELGANTKSSISEEIGASGSITAEVSEQILSQMSSSQPSSASAGALQTVHTLTSRGPSDYAMDTFESFQSSVSHHQDHPPPHPLPLVTSTPFSSIQGSLKKEPLLSDISITESVTSMTSDGSGLEERIKLLKLQLQQKKDEMKRFQTEKKRKKKEILRQQEEQLKRKLEIVENRAQQMKSAAAAPSIPLHSPGTATPTSSGSATPSQAYSEKSDSEMSRESTASPQSLPTPVTDLSHPPHPSLSVEREAPVIMKDEERSVSPASVQEQLSPAARSNSYTPFSDSITTGVHVTPTASSGDKVDGLVHVHEDTVIKVDADERRLGEVLSPTASIPEEHDTSHSTLIEEEEEEEEGREVSGGEGEDRQQEQPSVEVEEREKEVLGHEVEPIAEELSVKSDSISEHISDLSSEGEQLVDVEWVTVAQLSSNVEPRAEEGTPPPLGGEQYSESFEEPSSSTPASSPSSQTPPIGELTPSPESHEDAAVPISQVPPLDELTTPPIEPQAPPLKELTSPVEPQDEAAMATPGDEKPEDTTDITEHEQVDIPNSIDTKEFEEEIGYQVGQRVLVGNVMAGTVRYIGHTHFAKGLWVGVEIDLPRGRNDGSIDDQRYFSCKPNYGLFAPPQKITIMEEDPEHYDKEGEGEKQQPPFEDNASSVAEEIKEEQPLSEHELEEDNLEDRSDENTALEPPAAIAHEGTPPPVDDDMYSPDFESSPEESEEGAEADDEEERESEAKPEDGEGFGQVQVNDEPTVVVETRQEIEDYQWPRSEEGTRENSPMVEFNHHAGKEETPPPVISQLLQKHQAEEHREKLSTRTQPPSETDREMETITEGIGEKKLGEKTSQITEHPPPASESLETLGEKSESFPQAPEVANQRSQSATPTPAPPPEFAEGALKEMSLEPPRELQTGGGETAASTLKQASEVISEELAQELTNEAYETMHNIWKVATKGQATEYEATDVVKVPLDKEAKVSLEDKADRVTDQLLAVLLQSETNVACSIHNFKKSQEGEEEHVLLHVHIPEKTEEETPSPTSPRTLLPRSPILREPERPVLSPVPEEPQDDEEEGQTEPKRKQKGEEQEEEVTTPPISPLRRGAPAKLILTAGTTTSSIIESSPPPLSPPSPYRNFVPSFIPAADEFSPPGSPPKHLSQASAARVAAGEKTPFLSSQDKERKGLERSTSTESITSLLDSLTIKTAQCMVPSERANVDQVVERSWQVCEEIGFENLHHCSPRCPNDILDMFSDLHELSPEENHCRRAYLELVFNLTVETLQNLHNVSDATPIWTQESAVRSLLVPEHKNSGGITLEKVQKRVYKALMRGQLPSQLPAVKFLRGMKRPGGREIDFVDTILIKELREEEPGWIDYCGDEASVKMKTADTILDSLITEAVQIMCDIGKKQQTRINNAHS